MQIVQFLLMMWISLLEDTTLVPTRRLTWIPKMMVWKSGIKDVEVTPFKHSSLLVSMLDFWGVYISDMEFRCLPVRCLKIHDKTSYNSSAHPAIFYWKSYDYDT